MPNWIDCYMFAAYFCAVGLCLVGAVTLIFYVGALISAARRAWVHPWKRDDVHDAPDLAKLVDEMRAVTPTPWETLYTDAGDGTPIGWRNRRARVIRGKWFYSYTDTFPTEAACRKWADEQNAK